MFDEPAEEQSSKAKPGKYERFSKMQSFLYSKRKLFALVMSIILYMYILYMVKIAYMRSKRLGCINNLAAKNEQLMNHIHRVDQQLTHRLIQLDDYFEE